MKDPSPFSKSYMLTIEAMDDFVPVGHEDGKEYWILGTQYLK